MKLRNYVIPQRRRGFSLLELSMVLVISGLMVSFMLEANQQRAPQHECYVVTKAQINTIRAAVERFARKNDRLPVPAARNVGVENIKYGREALTGTAAAVEASADLDKFGTGATAISYGALPFQALGLSPSFASDCWGNKFSYAVTTALTNSTGFKDSSVVGNITVNSSAAITTSTKAAYAIISHGEDSVGAAKSNFSAANPTHQWCSGLLGLKYMNCNIGGAVADAVFNNGKDAGTNYFDDVVLASSKPQTLSNGSAVYCWGDNSTGAVGDGSTTNRTVPTAVTMPSGVVNFTQLRGGYGHFCAIGDDAKTYCWGSNARGQLGDGTTTNSNAPKLLSGYSFVQIAAGVGANGAYSCGLTAAGAAYCWGDNDYRQIGDGTQYTVRYTPTAVNMPGGVTFKTIYAGSKGPCAVATNNDGYCWGDYASTPGIIPGGYKIKQFTIGETVVCFLTTAGDTYCWGKDGSGTVGNGSGDGNPYEHTSPQAVSTNGSVIFTKIAAGSDHVCGLTAAGKVYCWGYGAYGAIGNGGWSDQSSPTLVPSVLIFTDISASGYGSCGITNDGKEYCWGRGDVGQIGDGGTTNRASPTQVMGTGVSPLYFDRAANSSGTSCGLVPLPPVSWGGNSLGAVGDGTNIDRASPVYVKIPDGEYYFSSVSGYGDLKCGIAGSGKAYCWGANSTYQRIGNGTTTGSYNKPTAVTMPGGVTFKSVYVGENNACAIAADNKPYCWGSANYTGAVASDTPTLFSVPSTGISSMDPWHYGGSLLGSDGQIYVWGGSYGKTNIWIDLQSIAIPTATAQALGAGANGTCMIGNNGWVYCNGCSNATAAIGDDSTSGCSTSALVAVTQPNAGVTSFKSISTGDAGGGNGFSCAIANDDQLYCWGYGYNGMTGTNGIAWPYVAYRPLQVNLPAGGATSWKKVMVGYAYVFGIADDDQLYIWGTYGGTNYYVPTTIIPTMPGTAGYRDANPEGQIGFVK